MKTLSIISLLVSIIGVIVFLALPSGSEFASFEFWFWWFCLFVVLGMVLWKLK